MVWHLKEGGRRVHLSYILCMFVCFVRGSCTSVPNLIGREESALQDFIHADHISRRFSIPLPSSGFLLFRFCSERIRIRVMRGPLGNSPQALATQTPLLSWAPESS